MNIYDEMLIKKTKFSLCIQTFLPDQSPEMSGPSESSRPWISISSDSCVLKTLQRTHSLHTVQLCVVVVFCHSSLFCIYERDLKIHPSLHQLRRLPQTGSVLFFILNTRFLFHTFFLSLSVLLHSASLSLSLETTFYLSLPC